MKFNFGLYVLLLFWCTFVINAQNFDRINIDILDEGKLLPNSMAGGIKNGQFSNIDLNGDGVEDLFVFDRTGDRVLTFVKKGPLGSTEFEFDPSYISIFPTLTNWALLYDFNRDGIVDIFTGSKFYPSIEVWKGQKDLSGRTTFRKLTFDYGDFPESLQFPINPGFTPIYVNSFDVPAIDDVDSDGDYDIITFESDGSYASYYKNVSVEENLGLDSLKYIRQDICWGKFSESQFNEEITLSNNIFSCAPAFTSGNSGGRHSGSSLTLFDQDGDGDKDMLIGDLANSKIKKLLNGGDKELALITEIEFNFPKNDVTPQIDVFLASYFVDINGDKKRDLIVTSNDINSGDNNSHIWAYINEGSDNAPIFKNISKNFLVDQMAYFNSGTHPAFADVNADGLMDIVIGTNGSKQLGSAKLNKIVLLLNIGTASNPKYTIENKDFLGFSIYDDKVGRFSPAFGDLDGDKDVDLVIGQVNGTLFYLENIAGENKAMVFAPPKAFYFDINVGRNAKPQIIDLDTDGLSDLVVGVNNNLLYFFKNIGSKNNPIFNSDGSTLPNTDDLGQVFPNNNNDTKNGAPFFFNTPEETLMLMGSNAAELTVFGNIDNNVFGAYDKKFSKLGNINAGLRSTASLADIDNDGYYEIAVGNESGGITFYNTIFKTDKITQTNESLEDQIYMFPNPASQSVYISVLGDVEKISLFDAFGQQIMALSNHQYNDITRTPSAVYFIKIETKAGNTIKKLVVTK